MRTFDEVLAAAKAGDAVSQDLLAQAMEQMGRLDEALSWWMEAAKRGHPGAHAKLGLWQLVGFQIPQNIAQGVERIHAAARAGDDLGLALACVVDSGGVGVERNLRQALDWLVMAAKRGDPRAATQLALLAGLEGDVGPMSQAALAAARAADFEPARRILNGARVTAVPVNFDALAAGADLAAFEAPRERETLSEAPAISIVRDLLAPELRTYVTALAEPALKRGMIVNDAGGESVEDVRSNRVMHFGLADSDVVLELINHQLAAIAGLPVENGEGLGVLHYAPGERYAPHVDYIPETPANAAHLAARGQRVRTVLVYLNEAFEGGATEFPRLDLKVRPPAGSVLAFDSVTPAGAVDLMTLHTGAAPTSGEKWIISKWFRTKALRPPPRP